MSVYLRVCVCFYCACRAKTISVYIVNVSKFQSQTAISIGKSIHLINRLIFSGIVFVVRFKHFRFQIGELRWRTSLNVCVSVFVSQCPTIASTIHKINALLCTLFGFFLGVVCVDTSQFTHYIFVYVNKYWNFNWTPPSSVSCSITKRNFNIFWFPQAIKKTQQNIFRI